MYLHYLVKLKMMIAHVIVLLKKRNSRIYVILTVASKFTIFEFS